MTLIIPPQITAQADADPALARAFATQISREKARYHSDQNPLHGYGRDAWREPFVWATPEALLDAARQEVAQQAAWEKSHYGQFVRAEQRAEDLARRIATELDRSNSGRSRAGGRVDTFVMERVHEIHAMATELANEAALMELMGPAAMADAPTVRADVKGVCDLIDAMSGGRS